MEKITIRGGKPLRGEIEVSGMKNAAVAVILSCLLIEDTCTIENLPDISDVDLCLDILKSMGAKVTRKSRTVAEINCKNAQGGISPYNMVRGMRASYYLIGAELGRYGRAYVGLPGGCDFGTRPIDQHIKGFEALGAKVSVEGGYIDADAGEGLIAAPIYFDGVTVGGTMNLIIAAVRAKGTTVIENAAREPHIVDLANFLNTCGAQITGAGTDVIKIKGVQSLHGCSYAIIPDMIEAGTYMIAAAACGGTVRINGVIPKHLDSVSAKLIEMGVVVEELDESVIVSRTGPLTRVNVKTMPYPGFPTDMNPQMCVLMCLAAGTSYLTESVWESRFRYVDELKRMGANIKVDGKMAIIEGGAPISAAPVKAVDLRAGAAVVIMGLVANGKTVIEDIHHIKRGYDHIVEKLRLLGADIEMINTTDDEGELKQAN